jgi:subtilase family serine protease
MMVQKATMLFLLCLLVFLAQASTDHLIKAHAAPQKISALPKLPKRACSILPIANVASCGALVVGPTSAPGPSGNASPTGGSIPYRPQDIRAAYNLPLNAPSGQYVAIAAAYDDPNAAANMATYRSTFGLSSCPVSNGCFLKVNQSGGTSPLPTANTGWAQEISLDLDMISAVCQNCKIILVEAKSDNLSDLGTATNTAVSLGAKAVNNSYGSSVEYAGENQTCNAYYNHPKVAITASSGDNAGILQVPAVCPNVISVGGTSLQTNGSETVWRGAGGGCSTMISKPVYQNYTTTGCANRAVSDISAVADPNTGVYVYDTYNGSGWYQIGGTSASSPIIAAIYGLAGNANTIVNPQQALGLAIISGSCSINRIPGRSTIPYTYQTGLGTPNGLSCF